MKVSLVLFVGALLAVKQIEASFGDREISYTTDNYPACESCNKFFGLISNITHGDPKIKDRLVQLCLEYSRSETPVAKEFCDKTINAIYNAVNFNLNTSRVCSDIKACPAPKFNVIDRVYNGPAIPSAFGNKIDCDFCVSVAKDVKDIITGSPTELKIKANLEDACHYTGSYENDCVKYVDEYVDSLMEFIKISFQPQDLCKSLKACSAQEVSRNHHGHKLHRVRIGSDLVRSESTFGDINCDICKKIVKIIQRQLKDNATDEQIINVLTEVCDLFPRSDRQNCINVVTNYASNLIQLLSQDIDPDTACAMANLCTNSKFSQYLSGNYLGKKLLQSKNLTRKTVECEECELIAHFIQSKLYNYKNEEQIEEYIKHHLCPDLRLVITRPNCEEFVNNYAPIILQTIAQELFDPNTLCYKELPICSPKTKKTFTHQEMQASRCSVCQSIVSYMHKFDRIDMEQLVQRGCNDTMPIPLKVECQLMLKAFGPHFFEMLHRYDDDREICRSLDLCIVPGRVHLLGGSKCTYGPSYWCHSEHHANACNASSYCRDTVWKPVEHMV